MGPYTWAIFVGGICFFLIRAPPAEIYPLPLPRALRIYLTRVHKLNLPNAAPARNDLTAYGDDDHKRAFLGFLTFLKMNLAGQTSIRTDPSWASQLTLLQGMAQFAVPDLVLREDSLDEDLGHLASQMNLPHVPAVGDTAHRWQGRLTAIYDQTLEDAARAAYARDYAAFGFGNWS